MESQESDQSGSQLNQTSSMIEVTSISVRVEFSMPDYVSEFSFAQDQLLVGINKEMLETESRYEFVPGNSGVEFDSESGELLYEYSHKIPSFDVASSRLISFGENVKNALSAFLGANLVISLVSASLLQYLWGMINALQIVVLTVLFNLEVPINSDMVMKMMLKFCSMDFL